MERKRLLALNKAVNFLKDSRKMTYEDLEKRVKISKKTIRKYLSSGEGQPLKIDKLIIFLQQEAPQFFYDKLSRREETAQNRINDDLGKVRARGSRIQGRRIRPDPLLTPGSFLPVTVDQLCDPEYYQKIERSSPTQREQVCHLYGISSYPYHEYRMDYLIPLGLGGTSDIENIWPQPIKGQWNCHDKDLLEQKLRELVCSGQLPLEQAQKEIATDWIAAYQKYIQ